MLQYILFTGPMKKLADHIFWQEQHKKFKFSDTYHMYDFGICFIGNMRNFCIRKDILNKILIHLIASQASLIDICMKSVSCFMNCDETL